MDSFLKLRYKPNDLKILNQCRLYLQVYSLTDITSADGRIIVPHYKVGIMSQDRKSNLRWPTQQRPGKKAWTLWQQALQHMENNGILARPLGGWLQYPHQTWHWYMDPTSSILHHNHDESWYQIKPLGPTNRRTTRQQAKHFYQMNQRRSCGPPNASLLPATVQNDHIMALATTNVSPAGFPSKLCQRINSSNFYECLTAHPFYERLLGSISMSLESAFDQLSQAIVNDSLHICTDGSYNPEASTGSHGWVFASERTKLWHGAGPSDGHPSLMSPYRAELSGLVAGLHILTTICQQGNIVTGSATMYCDCEKAIKNVTTKSYRGIKDFLGPDSNLLQEAKHLLQALPIQLSLQWVESHYSGNNPSIAQELNCFAHQLAHSYLKHPHPSFSPSQKVIDPPSERASINYDGSKITSKLPSLLRHQLHDAPLIRTICKEAK